MKTSLITGTLLSIALLGSAAVQAANFLPEEPFANYAIEQAVTDQVETEGYAISPESQGLYWGEAVDSLK